jgi:hypothetical protein
MRLSGLFDPSILDLEQFLLVEIAGPDELLSQSEGQGGSDMLVQRAFVSNPPAAPSTGQTVVLFATHPRMPGGSGTPVTSTFATVDGANVVIEHGAIRDLAAVFGLHDHASAANGLRAYYTNDAGTTWHETDVKGIDDVATIGAGHAIQVPTLSAGQEWAEVFHVGRYRGFALEYTAGATPPTPTTGWDVNVSVVYVSKEN